MSLADPQMSVRLPGDLKPRLAKAAKENGRTINADIVTRLERSFSGAQTNAATDEVKKSIDEVKKMIEELHQTTKASSVKSSIFRPKSEV